MGQKGATIDFAQTQSQEGAARATGVAAAWAAQVRVPVLTPLNSSNLAGLAYEPSNQRLFIEFRNGAVYAYEAVPAETVQAVLKAPSHGSAFVRLVRGQFQYVRVR